MPRVLQEELSFYHISSVADEVEKQRELEGPRSDHIVPIGEPVLAEAHTPVYKMHRFFARRPYNFFAKLVRHYAAPGEIILDPFMGGGVTVVEALRARRKVVGVDLNPIAWLITKHEVSPVNLSETNEAFAEVESQIRRQTDDLYRVACPHCGQAATIQWAYWSSFLQCTNNLCKKSIVIDDAEKVNPGRYKCPHCGSVVAASKCKRFQEKMIKVQCYCDHCNKTGQKAPTRKEISTYRSLTKDIVTKAQVKGLPVPEERIPDGDRVRDDALYQKGYTHFYQLFTPRNLLANAMLRNAILASDLRSDLKEVMMFAFSASLTWSCKMSNDTGHGWQHHGYWLPETHYEMNVWNMFEKLYRSGLSCYVRGKKYSNREIGDFCALADCFQNVKGGDATCMLLRRSSHDLPIPDGAVDVIITDPPFGGNVQYAELANFWTVWLDEILENDGVIDNRDEAIETRNTGFLTEKSREHYENTLFRVFKECHRVLKPDGWMVLTFHNRDVGVWMALQRAANRAGFKLPPRTEDPNRGMLYQPPIPRYTPTLHLRAPGSMLGDFVLSFKRQETIPVLDGIVYRLTEAEERELVKVTRELIEFHGGATENLLMTGLLPHLQEANLLHRLAKFNFRSFFDKHFIRHRNHWYTEDQIDAQTKALKPIDVVPAQQLTESLIVSYLREHKYATPDELLVTIYTNLVNNYRPGVETIDSVLSRLCNRRKIKGVKREVYVLKPTAPEKAVPEGPLVAIQAGLFGEDVIASDLSHDQIIELLTKYVAGLGYRVHIGETEQRKTKRLKDISHRMLSYTDYGLPSNVFDTVKEIDLVVIHDTLILAAFEVTTTVETANKAINDRFRNLFAATPNLNIKGYVIVKDSDIGRAQQILFTVANVQERLPDKVKIVKLSRLTSDYFSTLFRALEPHSKTHNPNHQEHDQRPSP